MKSITLRLLLSITLLTLSFAAFSQDSTKTFTLSGSVDVYFHRALGKDLSPAALDAGNGAPATSFANLNGFSLGMVNLIGSYAGEKVGFTADLVFGPRGYDAVFGNTYSFKGNPSFGQRIINQMFVYYKLSDVVTLNLGQFNTFVGMETITPVPNFHYSTSYLFTNGPFNHTGLRADFNFKSGFVMKLALMNPTDIVEFNKVDSYTLGAQFGYTNEKGGAWLNFLYGDPDGNHATDPNNVAGNLFQADLTTGWTLSDKFYLGLNASYRTVPTESGDGDDVQFYGVAIYPKVTLTESFALGLRAEHFVAKNGYPVVTPFTLDDKGNGSVDEVTLSGNWTAGALRIIPEVRLDMMENDSYFDTKDKPVKQMVSVNLAAVYKF